MAIRTFEDPGAFVKKVDPLLKGREAANNLFLGIAGVVRDHPDVYPEFRLWLLMHGGVPVAAALRTLPFSILLAEPADADSAGELASHLARLDPEAPGAVGNLPGIDRFVRAWGSVTGDRAEVAIRQGVFELKRVRETASAPGRSRPATEDDRPLLRSWIDAFIAESYPQGSPLHTERLLDSRLSTGDDAGLWLWERGSSPVSLAGYSGPTGTGIRVGPVYSPPENRGRGYATSLVRELSAWLLGQGYSACFLYTDLANATSNAIYERIGYRRVAESREFRFLRG